MTFSALSAHVGYLFTELDLLERVGAAARAGFTAIEHPNPMSVDAHVMAARLQDHGLVFSQMAAASGDGSRGEKGLTALAGRQAEFRDAFRRSLDYAEAIGCRLVQPMAGVVNNPNHAAGADAVYRANLAYAVEECHGRPLSVMIEAISETAVPGYFLSTLEQALVIADAVAPSRIHLLLDTFHAAASGVDIRTFIASHAHRIGHVHIADHPGRHEPGTGDLVFEPLLDQLRLSGYRRAIGFEYIPSKTTADTLGWLPSFRGFFSP
jgi:2-dehydrotetronate isomerase